MIAAFCIGEETQNFFAVSLSHSLRFTGVQGRFLASLEMTIREDGLSHIPFHPFLQKAAPAGQIYPPPSAHPFFKGLLYWHAKTQSAREISIV